MTRLFNDPSAFTDDALRGFIDAHKRYVRGVAGGVVRASAAPRGRTAVVIGGGSGHYPAFCGLVGAGLADGAVVGNVFTSPSATQAESVGREAESGGGVLLMTGNYTGDVINFRLARDALRAAGIDAAYLTVTDDVASAAAGEEALRRGVAGGLIVFKAAGAAAGTGAPLSDVVAVAGHANALTRTLGVAFGGCTLPGDEQPLFTVPDGRMSVGLGIHGEPGIAELPLPTAQQLADLLVDRLVQAAPVGASGKVAAILNGLGGVKYEELFVVWAAVADRLRGLGLEVVDPEVGELVTSLDMAGCSLSLAWLDDELETLWRAPADSPAFRKAMSSGRMVEPRAAVPANDTDAATDSKAEEVDPLASEVVAGLERMSAVLVGLQQELGRLDSVAGDGDHGRGMTRGASAALSAARNAASRGGGAAATLQAAGEAWASSAGGTSGVLWGAALTAAATSLGPSTEVDARNWLIALRAAYDQIRTLGGAVPGDKTLLDALEPFIEAFGAELAAGTRWRDAWATATDTAEDAAQRTASMSPRIGRARPLAEQSVGTPDPGAVSLAACLRAAMPPVPTLDPSRGDGTR